MRRARAIEHLRTVIDTCERDRAFHRDSLLVVELWAAGRVLEPGDLPGGVEVVFVLALPPDQLPWGVTPLVLRAFISGHRLDNKPIVVHARPAGRPVCTRGLPRAARVWTAEGPDHGQLEALADPESDALKVSSLEDVAEADRERETAVSHQFLVDAVANFWDRDWRARAPRQRPDPRAAALGGTARPPRAHRRQRPDLSRPPPPPPDGPVKDAPPRAQTTNASRDPSTHRTNSKLVQPTSTTPEISLQHP